MKKILIIFALYTNLLISQNDFETNYFKTNVKDTFNNESVVIIRDYTEYDIKEYSLNSSNSDYMVNYKSRIQYKLKDKHALEMFSTLTEETGINEIRYNIIKPNGKVINIYKYDGDFNKTTRLEDLELDYTKNELAIENLEINDLVEMVYIYTYNTSINPLKELKSEKGDMSTMVDNPFPYNRLSSRSNYLRYRYPVVSLQFYFNLNKKLKLESKFVHCNYKFDKVNDNEYSLNINNLTTIKTEDFFYYTQHPHFKFAILEKENNPKSLYNFRFESADVKDEEIANLVRKFYLDKKFIKHYYYIKRTGGYVRGTNSFVKSSLPKFFKAFENTFCKDVKDPYTKLNLLHEYIVNTDQINPYNLQTLNIAVILARYCDKLKIPYDFIAGLSYQTQWKDILFPGEIEYGIRVKNPKNDEYLYILNYEENSNIYQINGAFANSEVLVFNKNPKIELERVSYPKDKFNYNVNNQTIYINEIKNNEFQVKQTTTHYGSTRYFFNDYVTALFNHEKLRTNSGGAIGLVPWYAYSQNAFKDTSTYFTEMRRIGKSWSTYWDTYNEYLAERYLIDEYKFEEIKIDSVVLKNDGNYADNEEDTAFAEAKFYFKVNNFIEKTNIENQFVTNLGSLISTQLDLTNYKENERDVDIFNQRQRQYNTNIEFVLPKGYNPINLEDFNINFKNEAGEFTSKAEIKDGILYLTVTKTYLTNYLPKEKWNQMTEFLKVAAIFYDRVLLLEKQ